ncbi:MAG: sugar transferase [Sediminibacterium sp.]|nr:sugar transferase [Sediminibacterium sp.]
MIDNASISSIHIEPSKLTVVLPRQRDQIDRKRNYFIFKRVFDILFSLCFIILVLSWLLPILAILLKLTSRGPVFFLQKRIGFAGKTFTCYKFRTMVINDEAHTRQASENDRRITKFGRFLRKSNIDEFPQFLNILKGDMSLIGPRPHMYADCRNFSAVLPGYKFRNMVRPGLTGLAQVKGYHGPTTTRSCVIMRYHWDNYYIQHAGFILDFKIMLFTVSQRLVVMSKYLLQQMSPLQKNSEEVLPN